MSIEVLTPPSGVRSVRVEVLNAAPATQDPAVERRWAEMLSANPRLFDGPVLALDQLDLGAGIARCRRESYKRLAVGRETPGGIEQLSVTGVLTRRDAGGKDCVLLGRRGEQTGMYGGMWELAPSGGLDPPVSAVLSWDEIVEQLQAELADETGLREPITGPRLVCAVRDAVARSADLVIGGVLEGVSGVHSGNWEYPESAWMPVSEVRAFCEREPVIGTSLAVLSLLGWR